MGAVLVFLYIGEHALGILLSRYYSLVVTYSFLSVPLFIFMASLLERSNIARDLYDALNAWLRKTRGGVGVVTAIMATIMAAMSGIIGGEIVLLGLIALPQMLRLKYDQDMSIGISRGNRTWFNDLRFNNYIYSYSNKTTTSSCAFK
jgi:TRAP-type mannitol/chloroaromatic compound transport system permease large subunit